MDQRIIDLYDDFVHVHFDRRLFLDRASKLLGGMGAATAALTMLRSDYANAATIAENDSRVATDRVTYKGVSGDVKGYLARPKADGKRGGIVVVHQNRGLNAHIEDIARRFAVDGYTAIAVDFLSQLGGTPKDEEAAMAMFPKLDNAKVTGDANAAADWLLANYADPKLDTRLGGMLPDYEKALKDAKINYQLFTYEGANHAFNDDTAGDRYNANAAKLAWGRTMDLFKANVA